MKPHGEIRLGKSEILLCLQEEKGQVVLHIIAVTVDSADGDIEADRKSRKVFRGGRAAHVDDLVEFEKHAFKQLQRFVFCHPVFNTLCVIRFQDHIEAARGE